MREELRRFRESTLQNLATAFKEKNDALPEAVKEGHIDSDLLGEKMEEIGKVYSQIQEILGNDELLVEIKDVDLRKALRSIRDNNDKKFVFFGLLKILGIQFPFVPSELFEKIDELREEINCRINPFTIIESRIKIGTLILGQSVPDIFRYNFQRIKDCYCFGFSDAASIWCRSLLEAGVMEALRKRGKLNLRYLDDEKGLAYFINQCSDIYEKTLIDKMHYVRKKVNRLLHSENITEKEEMDHTKIIKYVFDIIENIFEE